MDASTAAQTKTTTARLIVEPCTLVSVHDADTFRARLPLDALWAEIVGGAVADVRVAHVNAAELSTTEGQLAQANVEGWLVARQPLRLLIYGREKYGRVLADAISILTGDRLSDYVLGLEGSVPLSAARQLAL